MTDDSREDRCAGCGERFMVGQHIEVDERTDRWYHAGLVTGPRDCVPTEVRQRYGFGSGPPWRCYGDAPPAETGDRMAPFPSPSLDFGLPDGQHAMPSGPTVWAVSDHERPCDVESFWWRRADAERRRDLLNGHNPWRSRVVEMNVLAYGP